jgi:hypothetical protein
MESLPRPTQAELQALFVKNPHLVAAYCKALKRAKAVVAANGKTGWLIGFRALNAAGEYARAFDEALGIVHTAAHRTESLLYFCDLAKETAEPPSSRGLATDVHDVDSGRKEMGGGIIADLKTTVLVTGLGTSFSKAGSVYLVSTIHRKELGGFYQTSILKCSSSHPPPAAFSRR